MGRQVDLSLWFVCLFIQSVLQSVKQSGRQACMHAFRHYFVRSFIRWFIHDLIHAGGAPPAPWAFTALVNDHASGKQRRFFYFQFGQVAHCK